MINHLLIQIIHTYGKILRSLFCCLFYSIKILKKLVLDCIEYIDITKFGVDSKTTVP